MAATTNKLPLVPVRMISIESRSGSGLTPDNGMTWTD
jgi:hypothetical protein